jgi:glycosyltransferase involved in cell wall biosynthesis
MLSFILAIIALIFIVVRALIFGDPTSGWPSLVCIILALGGLQLFCLGILGQYLGKTFLETKKRPIYILKEKSDSLTN